MASATASRPAQPSPAASPWADLQRAATLGQAVGRAVTLLDGATPHTVAWRRGPVALRVYAPAQPPAQAPAAPVVFVTPIINRFRLVDLEPETSLVGRLVARGHTVWLLDWGTPAQTDQGLDWEDLVLDFVERAVASAAEAHGVERVDLVGLCLGGTIATVYAAVRPARVRRLATLVTPIDFADMDVLGLWTDARWFPVERLTAAFGNMPGQLVNQGFWWQRPLVNALKLRNAWPRLDDPAFAGFFTVLESWTQDPADVFGAAYRRLIRELYRENRLVAGRFTLAPRGRAPLPVDLGQIRCPLFVAAAQDDLICPPAAAWALLERAGTPAADQTRVSMRGGHVTPIVGPRARGQLQDPLASWLLGE